ncbi:MAG: efflux RND transporter periplasmic adaptor subunit [Candidatus Aureabacteria bacterium]|nr:efflux RND transporter periplasmic adaptor subunit [Candidatus Auribacterota bacterium]
MHPSYTSNKPGDCPICNMKLVKTQKAPEGTPAANASPRAAHSTHEQTQAKGKTPEEICIEHHCTMKNCPMMVRAHVKPGEKLRCPTCGEYITTVSDTLIEVTKTPPAVAKQPEGPKKARKFLYYRNPMNPQVTSPVPMKDSMGMDYVPVYEGEQPEAGKEGVYISPEKQKLIGVATAEIKKIALIKTVRASGKIAYDPELFVTQEEFIQALNSEKSLKGSQLQEVVERARSLTEAARRKLKLLGMNDDQIAQLERTRKADRSLYLPRKGEDVWAYFSIYEYDIGLVKVGAPVGISATAYPGEKFEGKVASINPVLDPMTRTNQARVKVANPEDTLKPEMFVTAEIKVELGNKLAVPDSAVLDTGLRKIVYLAMGEGILESKEIKVGQKAEGYYEVLDGLHEGDSVVTSGNFLVDSESSLKSAIGSQQHQHDQ